MKDVTNAENGITNKIQIKEFFNFIGYFAATCIVLYFLLNSLFSYERIDYIRTEVVERSITSVGVNRKYYILKFYNDPLLYSVEILPETINLNPGLIKLLNSKIKTKFKKKTADSTADNSTYETFKPIEDKIKIFNTGDSIFIEKRVREYLFLMKPHVKYRIQGIDAKIYTHM